MDERKVLDRLEHDLSHYLISENCKNDPSKRGSPDMYKYRGLNITADTKSKKHEKTICVRIGVLEAEFKVDSCDKSSGSLAPEDERLVMLWMMQNDNHHSLKTIFGAKSTKKELAIIPFDLEDYYTKS